MAKMSKLDPKMTPGEIDQEFGALHTKIQFLEAENDRLHMLLLQARDRNEIEVNRITAAYNIVEGNAEFFRKEVRRIAEQYAALTTVQSNDYKDMRRFQASFIRADHERIAYKEVLLKIASHFYFGRADFKRLYTTFVHDAKEVLARYQKEEVKNGEKK